MAIAIEVIAARASGAWPGAAADPACRGTVREVSASRTPATVFLPERRKNLAR
jgi:hypothetical protein